VCVSSAAAALRGKCFALCRSSSLSPRGLNWSDRDRCWLQMRPIAKLFDWLGGVPRCQGLRAPWARPLGQRFHPQPARAPQRRGSPEIRSLSALRVERKAPVGSERGPSVAPLMKGCGVVETPRIREINAGWRCPFPAWGCVCAAEKGPRFRGGRVLCSSHECPAQRAVTGSGGLSGAECPWGGALCQRGGQCGRSRGRCGIRRAGCPRDSRERPSGGPTRRWGLAGQTAPAALTAELADGFAGSNPKCPARQSGLLSASVKSGPR
jgi:hypothetical protein